MTGDASRADRRVITGVAIYRRGDALVVRVEDDEGDHGWAESVGRDDLEEAIITAGGPMIGRSPWDAAGRWAARSRAGGTDWLAGSAIDSACFDLVSRSIEMPMRQWLGGVARETPVRFGNGIPVVESGDRSFDELVPELSAGGVSAVLADPRRWGVGALLRLDSVCRVLQIEIALDVRGAGPLGRALATELALALPMATLGVRADQHDPDPAPIDARPPVAVIGATR